MNNGNGNIPAASYPQLVKADFQLPFTAYVTEGKKKVRIAGPSSSNDRRLRIVVNAHEGVSIETDGLWMFHVEHLPQRGEHNSGIPVELGLPEERPLSLRDEMMRFIRSEISRQADDTGQETFEEANDFDVDEDEWKSPYELIEMVDEEPIDDRDNSLENQAPTGDNTGHEKAKPDDPNPPLQRLDAEAPPLDPPPVRNAQ